MKFVIEKEALLGPLQFVNGAVERRQTLPILSNVLMAISSEELTLSATDLEVEMVARIALAGGEAGQVTVPARKITDICRALPSGAEIAVGVKDGRLALRSGRSRFNLSILPADDFPNLEGLTEERDFSIRREQLKRLLERTQFAMAQQDVRYYLNGLLLERSGGRLRAVATDGHRLALCETELEGHDGADFEGVIVPRKGVLELSRLVAEGQDEIRVAIGAQAIRVSGDGVQLTSKLIDGKFPDYTRVVPAPAQCARRLSADRELLRQSLSRAAILSNEKYRAVRLCLDGEILRILAHNPEQEEAEEEVEISYEGDALEVGFNVAYLIDALGAIPSETVRIDLMDGSSSCLIRSAEDDECQYVVMPMRL